MKGKSRKVVLFLFIVMFLEFFFFFFFLELCIIQGTPPSFSDFSNHVQKYTQK